MINNNNNINHNNFIINSIPDLDVSKFNTQNVKIYENMFYNCPISNNIKKLNNFKNLKNIY